MKAAAPLVNVGSTIPVSTAELLLVALMPASQVERLTFCAKLRVEPITPVGNVSTGAGRMFDRRELLDGCREPE